MEKHLLQYLKEYSKESNKEDITRLRQIMSQDIASINNRELTYEDMLSYLYSILSHPDHTVTKSQELAEFNRFIGDGIIHIINNTFSLDTIVENERDITAMDKSVKAFNVKFAFLDTTLESPRQIDRNGNEVPKNPDDYRINNDSYMSDIILTVKITLTAVKHNGTEETKEGYVNRVRISAIPIMVGSALCNTYGMSKEMKDGINEDSDDPGGYFIIGGNEYVIMNTESSAFNKARFHKTTLKNERCRASILSQSTGGSYDSSMQLIVRYMTDGSILFDIQTKYFNKQKIPFFVIFRMFGIGSDKEIMKLILHDLEQRDEVMDKLRELVAKAFKVKYADFDKYRNDIDMVNNLQFMYESISTATDITAYRTDPEAIKFATNYILDKMDKNLLPHVGETSDVRYNKLCLIGTFIRGAILLDLGIKQEDDRDTIVNKRAHGAGISLARSFKKLFNAKVVMQIRNILRDELKTKSFDTININDLGVTVRNAITGEDLKTSFEKYVNASEKESVRQKENIRMSSHRLERKNTLNVSLTLRTIIASISKVAKTTSRADKIRYCHPTAVGIYCPSSSPESGEKVGTIKQMAITMIVTRTRHGASFMLKTLVKNDEDFLDIANIPIEDVPRKKLSKIIIDGDWNGCCAVPHKFVEKYRLMRRRGELDRQISIMWNCVENEVLFYTDSGRMMRPLLIVDNNLEDFLSGKSSTFVQNIRLTPEIIGKLKKREITFEDLVVCGYVEYIFPGEEVLLCPSLKRLKETTNDYLIQWTHCDIEQASFGLSLLIGPFTEHNGQPRNTLVTVHSKQSCGQPMRNIYTASLRQLVFHQHRIDNPMVKTITQQLFPPNSQTLMVLYSVMLGIIWTIVPS